MPSVLRFAFGALLACMLPCAHVPAQACQWPVPPAAGFATTLEPAVEVAYSDGYRTYGSLLRPDVPPPACGWPLVVLVHPLGTTRAASLGLQTRIAARGFAVWSYDVRGHGQAVAANPGHPQVGTTLWGAVERCDLAEQIRFVGQHPTWAGEVDASRCAVMGSSQGGAHAWNAAAWSGRQLGVVGRTLQDFPAIACIVASDHVGETSASWLRDGELWNAWFVELLAGSFGGFELDPGLRQAARAAFVAQDPAALLAHFAAQERDIGAGLATSTVPILYTHAFHDRNDSPLLGLVALQSSQAPVRCAVLTTGGPHCSVVNDRERNANEVLTLRWLRRWLWDEPTEVDVEEPFVLAELPLDPAQRDDPSYPWSRHYGGDPLQPAAATRLWLHSGATLELHSASNAQPVASIVQALDPLVGLTPQDYLDVPSSRELVNLLDACPLDEEVYTLTLQEERQLSASAKARFRVVPRDPDWMLAALLTVEPPGLPEVLLTSGCIHNSASASGVAESHEVTFPPVATRIPAGSVLRLRLRNLWLREAPIGRVLEVAPRFCDFQVDIVHGPPPFGSWLDLPLEPVRPKLVSAQTWFDLATAPVLTVRLRGGTARAHLPYYATFGVSGHVPATPFLNDTMPIESDWLVGIVSTSWAQPELSGFLGDLDAQGNAVATVDFRAYAPLPAALTGLRLTFAAFVFDSMLGTTGAATSPCDVLLR